MATSREIRVAPHTASNGTPVPNNNGHAIFQLSDLDLLMPKIYIQMIEIFELPADADKALILSALTKGLSVTLADHPILTGTLNFENEAKRIVVKTRADSSVALFVKEELVDASGGGGEAVDDNSLPSFSELDQKDFPVHLLKPAQVLPARFVGTFAVPGDNLGSDGPAVCGAQVTFIEGGLILGLTVTHQVCDGQGCEAILNSWSRHSMAATQESSGRPAAGTAASPSTTSDFLGRETLTMSGVKRTEPMSQEALSALGDKYPTNKARSGPPAPPPADFKMPVIKSRIWHFPKSKLRELKAICSSHDKTLTCRISTYDALLAIIWRALVRAKQPLLQPAPGAPSKVVHAVNARGRSSPSIPEGYIGVGVTMPQSYPALTVADVLDGPLKTTLPLLARNVRGSTESVTPEYVSDLISFAGNSADLRWTELDMHWVLGLDCMAFSWHGMKSYETHDFGFGKPAALRWPDPQFEGFFFVLPTRTTKKGSDDEGLEIMLGLEESCYGRFEQDEELLQFAEQRGID
ncbi:unnamed protein product [Discula destructiva]